MKRECQKGTEKIPCEDIRQVALHRITEPPVQFHKALTDIQDLLQDESILSFLLGSDHFCSHPP